MKFTFMQHVYTFIMWVGLAVIAANIIFSSSPSLLDWALLAFCSAVTGWISFSQMDEK